VTTEWELNGIVVFYIIVLSFQFRFFGLWRRVLLWYDTKVSKVHTASSVSNLPPNYTASQPSSSRLQTSPPWKHQNSYDLLIF